MTYIAVTKSLVKQIMVIYKLKYYIVIEEQKRSLFTDMIQSLKYCVN